MTKLTYKLFPQPAQPFGLSDIISRHALSLIVRERDPSSWGKRGESRYYSLLEFGDEGGEVRLAGDSSVNGIYADGSTPDEAIANLRRSIRGRTILVPDVSSEEEWCEELVKLRVPETLLDEPAHQIIQKD